MKQDKKLYRWLFWLIFSLAVIIRFWRFGSVPGDMNQDEAFAAYEAWSLLHFGIDSAGYRFPVYLTAWGSGMNALESYLMMPFLALFGVKVWVLRLPQLLVGLISVPTAFFTGEKLWGRRGGLLAMLLLALCPWHILLSRWGLESNLAPGFLLFAFYFFLKGMDKPPHYILSALFYGLSLYAYATIWVIVPFLVLAELLIARCQGKLRFDRFFWISAGVLFLLALPLLLFLLVNYGYLPELNGRLLSIPKLLYLRSGEVSFKKIPENLQNLFQILYRQSDGLSWNSAGKYGLLYPITLPFSLLGLVVCAVRCIRRRSGTEALLLVQVLAGLLLGALVHVNVNRVNILFIPLIFLAAEGFDWICGRFRLGLVLIEVVYFVFFGFFARYYFTDYSVQISNSFGRGLIDAVDALSDYDGVVVLSEDIHYPKILLLTETPPQEFRDSVEYKNYPAAFLSPLRYGRWRWGIDADALDADCAYLFSKWTNAAPFQNGDYSLTQYGIYTLALPKNGTG